MRVNEESTKTDVKSALTVNIGRMPSGGGDVLLSGILIGGPYWSTSIYFRS
jgi:hypothetical protein